MLCEAFLPERFLLGSRYCWGVWVTDELLFDFLRSAHTPALFYFTAHLATAHRWQWDCFAVDTLTCPGRKLSRRITDWCIPFIGGPAIVHAGHMQVSLPTCFFLLIKAKCGLQAESQVPSLRRSLSPVPGHTNLWQSVTWFPTLLQLATFGFYLSLFSLCLCSSLLYLTTMGRRHFKQPVLPLNPP